MNKKGQVTAFIMVGVVIVVTFILLSLLNESSSRDIQPTLEPDTSSLKLFVENCILASSLDALHFVAAKGGYYDDPDSGVDYFFTTIPYYVDKGNNLLPTKSFVEKNIAMYIDDDLPFCLNDFVDFRGLNIKEEESSSSVVIDQNNVVVSTHKAVTIVKGDSSTTLQDFETTIEIPFNNLIAANHEFIITQFDDPSSICLSCLDDIANEYNINVTFEPLNEDSIVFTFILNETINEYPVEWVFANRYDIE